MSATKKRPGPARPATRTGRRRKAPPRFSGGPGAARILLALVLLALLLTSVAVAGYVIFFRVVVASARVHGGGGPAAVAFVAAVDAPAAPRPDDGPGLRPPAVTPGRSGASAPDRARFL